jgi:hypothetical protein
MAEADDNGVIVVDSTQQLASVNCLLVYRRELL